MHDVRPPQQPWVQPGQVDHMVSDMTATFAADVTLAQAQEHLGRAGQWLPVDGQPDASLGKLVETNSTGPLRLGYGAWRDLLLGVQFTDGQDRLITVGGRTVKNVAGYDLTKFMVGQGGVFGRIVTLTMRTYRQPEAALLARFYKPSATILNNLLTTSCRPTWAIIHPNPDAMLTCGYLGDEATVQHWKATLPKYGPDAIQPLTCEEEAAFRNAAWSDNCKDDHVRASVPPARLDQLLPALSQIGAWAADVAFGIVVAPSAAYGPLKAAAESIGGRAWRVGTSGPAAPAVDPAQARVLSELKRAFDPQNHLAPLLFDA